MKKIIAWMLTAALLVSVLSSFAICASEPDVTFVMTSESGSVGDVVEVKIDITKNPGIWAARFEVNFDDTKLELVDVENGTVFSNGEFMKSILTQKGLYTYYAQLESYGKSNDKTGTVLTAQFKIIDSTATSADVWLTFPNAGQGWYFSGENPKIDYTVPADGEVKTSIGIINELQLGDVDGNGKLNTADCLDLKLIIVGKKIPNAAQLKAADVYTDGKINVSDCLALMLLIVGRTVDIQQ